NPEDAANQIAYLYKRRYPISWIEMGEEADGKHIEPEDYATLYLQFAKAIHKLVPEAKLGGPDRSEGGFVAGGLCRRDDDRRRWRHLLFPLHSVAGRRRKLPHAGPGLQ